MRIQLNQSIEAKPVCPQCLDREWFGAEVLPALMFSFCIEGDELVFCASQKAPALLHPEASLGKFQELLWKYDTAEFFIAKEDCSRYLEFNLSPNGAWWSEIFTDPRVVDESAIQIAPTRCEACCDESGWSCSARIPMADLLAMGLDPRRSRMAVCAILASPQQIFLTSADKMEGVPDFHRLPDWPLSELL
ncbi:MAG: hypothetical protein R3Y56_00050 [Akkermansia sp.]